MIQGTDEWLEWRRQGVGGSDVAIVMGELEYGTPRGIWRIKRGLDKEQVDNFAMQRGREAEPRIRALYELETGIDAPGALVEHAEHPWMRVSLDCWAKELGRGAELKYPGREKHALALQGKAPSCYFPQVQYQMAVTGATTWDYVSFDGVGIVIVEVPRDDAYINERLLPTVKAFWEMVLNNEEPPLTERDYLILEDLPSMQAFERWKMRKLLQMQCEELAEQAPTPEDKAQAKAELKRVTKELEEVRAEIIPLVPHPRVLCNGVQVVKQNRKNGPVYDIRLKTS